MGETRGGSNGSRRGGIAHQQIGIIANDPHKRATARAQPLVRLRHTQLALLLLDPSGKPWIQQRAQDEEEEQRRTKSHKQPN